MTPEEERAALAEALGDEPGPEPQEGEHKCPDCGKAFGSAISLRMHRRIHQRAGGGQAQATRERPAAAAPAASSAVRQEVERAVSNTIGLTTTLIVPMAPHLGVTIAGVPDPERPGEWIVRSRAVMAGRLLVEHARTNPQVAAFVLRWVKAYNGIFEGGELLDIALAIPAAAAVDVLAVRAAMEGHDPNEAARAAAELTVQLPGPLPPIQPIKMVIPDVLEFVQENLLEPPAPVAAPASNGHRTASRRRRREGPASAPEPEVVEGGVTAT